MHSEAFAAVRRLVSGIDLTRAKVLEVGSYDVNGSVRPLLEDLGATTYIGLDLREGPGVDEVGDAATWSGGKRPESTPPFDLVVSTEALEHARKPEAIIANLATLLRPGGWLILTAAGPGRAPHSCDGEPVVPRGEHYANIDPDALGRWLEAGGWVEVLVHANPLAGDVYARARRPEASPAAAGEPPAGEEPPAETGKRARG